MNDERIGAEIGEVFARALPDMKAGWSMRAIAAVQTAQRAQFRPLRRRLALAVGAVMVLIGLGFIPLPMGKAPGALSRAMAMASQAATVHMVGRAWTAEGEYDFDMWASDDGFYRQEKLKDGEPVEIALNWGTKQVFYGIEGGKRKALEIFSPTKYQTSLSQMAGRSYINTFFEGLKTQLGSPPSEMKITEHREGSLWAGARDIVDAEFTVEHQFDVLGNASVFVFTYPKGDKIRIKAEIDPATNRLLRMTQYTFQGFWKPNYEAEYTWDVEIPASVREFQPPKGTVLTRSDWWEKRFDKIMAQADTQDWMVTLSSVDLNRDGDIYLALNRRLKPESGLPRAINGAQPIKAVASDSAGGQYTQLNYFKCSGDYWTTILKRASANGNPQTATLTIYPYPEGASEQQSVTFHNIPLPPRQNADDLWAAEREVIQY